MKKIIVTLLLLIGSHMIQAQEQQTWHTDIKKAIAISTKEQKPLFLFFTGSDWCGWCIKLQKEVFKTPEFTAWAKDNVVLVDLDFPRRTPQDPALKEQNEGLQQIFQVQGFPTIWFVKPTKKDGKDNLEQLGSQGYLAGGPSAWLASANQITARYVKDVPAKKIKKTKVKKAA